jgi:hypothetical protein
VYNLYLAKFHKWKAGRLEKCCELMTLDTKIHTNKDCVYQLIMQITRNLHPHLAAIGHFDFDDKSVYKACLGTSDRVANSRVPASTISAEGYS